MRNISDILDLRHKKSLRLGLLLVSTLFIISASALVYARLTYENALNVDNTSGVTTGSGTTAPAGESYPPAIIVVIAFSAIVISISLFGFLREAIKHKASGGRESSLTAPASTPRGEGVGLSLQPSSKQGEDWEESPRKEESEE